MTPKDWKWLCRVGIHRWLYFPRDTICDRCGRLDGPKDIWKT